MKKYEVSEQFIKEAHRAACSDWKKRLEREFPEVFKTQFIDGKWYINTGCAGKVGHTLFMYSSERDHDSQIGIDADGNWAENLGCRTMGIYPASDERVKEALLNEAKKRGFVKGAKFFPPDKKGGNYFTAKTDARFFMLESHEPQHKFNMAMANDGLGCVIFHKGIWATLMEEIKNDDPSPEEIKRVLKHLKNKYDI